MTQIYVLYQGSSADNLDAWKLLDLKEVNVEMEFGVRDINDLNRSTAPFSMSFDVPMTAHNKEWFRNVESIESDSASAGFDIRKKLRCRIYDNTRLLVAGHLQVQGVRISEQTFKCVFYGNGVTFFDAIKGREFRELYSDGLDLTDPFEHTVTYSNVTNSWNTSNDITGGEGNGVIVYPLFDYGFLEYQSSVYPAFAGFPAPGNPQGWAGDDGLKPFHLKPSINVKYVIEKMVAFAGFTLKAGGFFDQTVYSADDLYMLLATDTQEPRSMPLSSFRIIGVNQVDDEGVYLAMSDTAAGAYDPDNLTLSTGYFIAPYAGTYQFQLTVYGLTAELSANPTVISLYIQNNGEVWQLSSHYWNGDEFFTIQEFTLNLEENALVSIIAVSSLAGPYTLTSVWTMLAYNTVSGNTGTADIINSWPSNLTLDKFLRAIMDKFNLVMEVDDEAGSVDIKTYDDWLSAGVEYDWTDRVDADGPLYMESAAEYQAGRLIFRDAEGGDHRNVFYQNRLGRVKGTGTLVNDTDFKTGDRVVGEVFTPLRNARLRSAWACSTLSPAASGSAFDVIISEQWETWDCANVKYKSQAPILMFYHGLQDVTFVDGTAGELKMGTNAFTQYPLFTSLAYNTNSTDNYTLDWVVTTPDYTEQPAPNMGTVQKFWQSYIDDVYSPESRIVTCEAYLTPQDIADLSFNNYVRIATVQYRVLNVRNYIVGGDGKCTLVLFKGGSGRALPCNLVPEVLDGGVVQWTNADRAIVAGNEVCCRRYGYSWNPENDTCYAYTDPGPADDFTAAVNRNGGQVSTPLTSGATVNAVRPDDFQPSVRHTFHLHARTSNGSVVNAEDEFGQDFFMLPVDAGASITVEWHNIVSEGTDASETEFGEVTAVVENQSGTETTTSGDVFQRNTGSSVAIQTSGGASGTKMRIRCTGKTAPTDWYLQVTVHIVSGQRSVLTTVGDATFQDGDLIEYQNGDLLSWN